MKSKSGWSKEVKGEGALKMGLVFFNPLLAFLYSLKKLNTKSSYVTIFVVNVLFGISFSVSNVSDDINTADGVVYRAKFENIAKMSYQQYWKGLQGFFTFDDGKKDYFFETISFIITRFTNNYHFLFGVVAVIFSFFSLKSLKYFTSENKFDASLSSYILLYIFCINQIFNINGMRFWLAGAIAVFLFFKVFIDKKNIFFLGFLFLPFIHGTFWILIAVVLIFLLCKNFHKSTVVLFLLSFVFSSISLELARQNAFFLPPFLQKVVLSYTDENYVKELSQGSGFAWVAKLFKSLGYYYINLLVFLLIQNAKNILNDPKTSLLYRFLIFYMVFVNLVMPIPSMGNRYILLAYPLIAYLWLIYFKDRKHKTILYLFPIVFFLNIYSQLLLYKMVTGIYFFIAPSFYTIFEYLS
ncbi:EpsG family protein [Chryseobacterium hispalense]|uniref:EpsG family protein n=1 Tax=Chryseobacterium hispalense TaxID=1453492 RepID=UPI003919EE26